MVTGKDMYKNPMTYEGVGERGVGWVINTTMPSAP